MTPLPIVKQPKLYATPNFDTMNFFANKSRIVLSLEDGDLARADELGREIGELPIEQSDVAWTVDLRRAQRLPLSALATLAALARRCGNGQRPVVLRTNAELGDALLRLHPAEYLEVRCE